MKVQNMTNSNGNTVANQFIIINNNGDDMGRVEVFQSYDSVIAKRVYNGAWEATVYLDRDTWDYSRTTGKYRNQFLGETKAETLEKIKSGEYILTDLNS